MLRWPSRTPGSVSTSTSRSAARCASAKRRICAWAKLMSSITCAGRLSIRRLDLGRRQAEILRLPIVELHREFADRGVAAPHDIVQDRLDRLAHLAVGGEFFLLARAALQRADHGPSYSAVQPPSTTSAVPVISAAASEARNTTAPIRSSTVPSRPSLIRRTTSSWNARVVPERPGQRRVDEGRPDGVHSDAVRREVDRHRLGQPLDAVLAHAVDGAPRAADMAHLRGDVDDRAPHRGRRHSPRHRLRDEERGALVQRGDGVVVLLGHIEERRRPVGAGVVDQDVERRLASIAARTAARSVTSSTSASALPPSVADLGRGRLDLGRGARRQHDMRAGLRQGRGCRQADAAAGAGDQGAAAVEAEAARGMRAGSSDLGTTIDLQSLRRPTAP